MSTLGERLKKAKIQQRFTQDQLANHMNVTRSTISNWERGISEPSFDALQQLSAIFCTDFLADFLANARGLPVIEVISHANACIFSEITIDCSVNCVDQHGNSIKFRLFAPFCIAKTEE